MRSDLREDKFIDVTIVTDVDLSPKVGHLSSVGMWRFLIVKFKNTARSSLTFYHVAFLDVIVMKLLLSPEGKEGVREGVLFCFRVDPNAKILFPI